MLHIARITLQSSAKKATHHRRAAAHYRNAINARHRRTFINQHLSLSLSTHITSTPPRACALHKHSARPKCERGSAGGEKTATARFDGNAIRSGPHARSPARAKEKLYTYMGIVSTPRAWPTFRCPVSARGGRHGGATTRIIHVYLVPRFLIADLTWKRERERESERDFQYRNCETSREKSRASVRRIAPPPNALLLLVKVSSEQQLKFCARACG